MIVEPPMSRHDRGADDAHRSLVSLFERLRRHQNIVRDPIGLVDW